MIQQIKDSSPPPPRLTMDEYVEFMTQNIANRTLEKTLNQKNLEERITKPFVIHSDDQS